MQDQVIGCDVVRVTQLTAAGLPVLRNDASPRDRRRHEVLSEAMAGQTPEAARHAAKTTEAEQQTSKLNKARL
jgi:hypothetical protein